MNAGGPKHAATRFNKGLLWYLREIGIHEISVTELCVNGLMMVGIKHELTVRGNRKDDIRHGAAEDQSDRKQGLNGIDLIDRKDQYLIRFIFWSSIEQEFYC